MDEFVMRRRATEARVARLGTVTGDGRPHLVPCCFAVDGDALYTAVDDVKAKTTRALRRLDNIAQHRSASVLVDYYDDDWSTLWWIRMEGPARVVEATSPDGQAGVGLLAEKYEQYRARPIPGPLILLEIARWLAWP
jgi:PPOX class probable F420-dependent enzyme